MVIIEDSRQKVDKNAHIKSQLESLGHTVIRSKMLVGDYQIASDGSVVVDTKYGMGEIENNLIHDHERFKRECELAQKAGIKLVILIQDSKIKQLSDVFGWYNIRKKWSPKATSGRTLGKIMYTMRDRYGVEFQFSTKANMGESIMKILRGDPTETM